MAEPHPLYAALATEAAGRGARQRGEALMFRCPRHDDRTPSAWLLERSWGCFACGFHEGLTTLAQEWGVCVSESEYTLEAYAAEKGLDPRKLREWGLETVEYAGGGAVAIPYYDRDRSRVLRTQVRLPPGERDRFRWLKDGEGAPLYGLWLLDAWRDQENVLVVEGASDCHACWSHGVLAVGVPGSASWRREWAPLLEGRKVYVWQEPDEAGAKFAASVRSDLPAAQVLRGDPATKDPAALQQKEGAAFRDALNARVKAARLEGRAERKPPVAFDAMMGEHLLRLLGSKLEPVSAVPTMWPTWNRLCRGAGGGVGLAHGWHVVVAGSTGLGKTITANNLAVYAARMGERVGYVSLEMMQDEVETRQLAIASGIPIRLLEQGRDFSEAAFREAVRRTEEIAERTGGRILTNRRPISSLRDVVDSIRYLHEVHGCRMMIVDYLQLAWTGNAENLYARIVEVSHAVRSLAKELRVTTVGLSQFNRGTTTNGQRPTKEGLKGGGSLEEDADQVLLLHLKERRADEHLVEAILAKNRHGPVGEIQVRFDTRTLRMTEMEAAG